MSQEAHLVGLIAAGRHSTAEVAELFGVRRPTDLPRPGVQQERHNGVNPDQRRPAAPPRARRLASAADEETTTIGGKMRREQLGRDGCSEILGIFLMQVPVPGATLSVI